MGCRRRAGEGAYWICRGGKFGLDAEREWEGRWDCETEPRKGCWGGLNAGKGCRKWVVDEVEPEAEVEELDQGV
jgi:hypothetical protein